MKIAIIGSGISGVYAAHYLKNRHEITLYEANPFLGGHTDTHHLMLEGQSYAVDTGFIVFNEHNYINFCRFLQDLGVSSQPSDMTFSVSNRLTGLEYNATTLDKLFCQRRNLFSPRFYRLILDIIRFYRQAPSLLDSDDIQTTLGEYLNNNQYSQVFINEHILPMASALWSGPPDSVARIPIRFLVAFMHNHQMLQVDDRPLWRTVKGGSDMYLKAFRKAFRGHVRLNTPVESVFRTTSGVAVKAQGEINEYDQLVMACHSDQALSLLDDPGPKETEILGAINYQLNDIVLHTDKNLMPRHPKAWASWNALQLDNRQHHCTVTYCMNLLQNLTSEEPLLVTLNCNALIDPEKILVQRKYHHPVFTPESLSAQRRRGEINGVNRIWYAGAYWGWGFHEDGAKSAQDIVHRLQEC